MTGINSSNDRLILHQYVEITSNEYFSYNIFFREWKRRPRGMETPLRNHQEKSFWGERSSAIYYGLSNDHQSNSSFIHHLLRLMMSFSFKKKNCHNGSAVFWWDVLRSIAPRIILHDLCRWAPTDNHNHKSWMGNFSVDTTSILIQKTGILIAEKFTLMKIIINKHIVMFALYI